MFIRKTKRVTTSKIVKWIALALIILLFGAFFTEVAVNLAIKPIIKENPESSFWSSLARLLYYLEYPHKAEKDNVVIDNDYVINAVKPTYEFLKNRYDCGDFQTPLLTRLVYKYEGTLREVSPEGYGLIKRALLDFKYWMSEPGEDSMCFWSENHQILFAVAEYLVGKKWPDEIFTNDGASGREHMRRGESRINSWMEHRFYYGFSEYNSANYMQFNLGPMANFIEFGDNPVMVERMKMIMDLAVYEIASNMFKYTFMAPTGRAYAGNLAGASGDRIRKFTDYIWKLNDDWIDGNDSHHRMFLNFVSMCEARDKNGNKIYEIPEVLLDIGNDGDYRIIKSSSGLDTSELEEKGYVGQSDDQIMMQFGMEAFTNPEVISNTINYFANNGLLSNSFFKDFRYFNLTLIKKTGLGRFISEKLNPMPNGIALQRSNIYTYSTPYYQLANNQDYHPGSYGASQVLNYANFTENAVAFTAHPAREKYNATPGYWAGFGRAPSSAQYENINLIMYKLPERSGFLELYDVPRFTHTYLPEAFFDEVIIEGNYAFARVGDAYLALIGKNKLEYREFNEDSAKALKNKALLEHPGKRFDLIQHGREQFWIYELGDASKETFGEFKARIKSNKVSYDGDNLIYESAGKVLHKKYASDFTVNGNTQALKYKRFDCDYSITEREAHIIEFRFNGKQLILDWVNAKRTII